MRLPQLVCGQLSVLALAGVPAQAAWRGSVGAERMAATFSNVPNTAEVLTLVEAGDWAGNFLPDASNAAFAGTTILNRSSATGLGVDTHATVVGGLFFGDFVSLLGATDLVHAYQADFWLEQDFLGFLTTSAPQVEIAPVQNHSWIAGELDPAWVREINQRLDFAIERDGFVSVAGVNNGTSTVLPSLLAQAYNVIAVGVSTGAHSAGLTTYDGGGRTKPDLVAPDFFTSYATPKVSSSAGVLVARAKGAPHAAHGADLPRLVKALLLAGATKEEFPGWSRTVTRPLDARFGAGELNILWSYRILESGRAWATEWSAGGAAVPPIGWVTDVAAVDSLPGGAPLAGARTYVFDISPDAKSAPFSAVLTWHRQVVDGAAGPDWSPLALPLVNLGLSLHAVAANGFAPGALVDQSTSPVDNVEHIYVPSLPPGRYRLTVMVPELAAPTEYALAWRSTPSVQVAAAVAEAREQGAVAGAFTFNRTGPVTTPLWVPLTVSGTATPGAHYAALPASILFPAGEASVTLTVQPVSDGVAQGPRSIVVTVEGDYSVAAGGASPGGNTATVTLLDRPRDAWRFTRFSEAERANPAISGFEADPERDGLPNLLEYALGGDPLTPEPAGAGLQPILAVETLGSSRRLTLSYTQPPGRDDLSYVVEWSAALTSADWKTGADAVVEISRTPTAGGMRVVAGATKNLKDGPIQFLRLRIDVQAE